MKEKKTKQHKMRSNELDLDMSWPGNWQLDKRFRFENFVLDQNNSEAYEIAQKVLMGSLCGIPIVIHSATGFGKTHILQAIGNEALRRDPKVRVALFSVERFFNEFIFALRDGTDETFRAKIRYCYDVCLVDDLTAIDRKPQIQRELFLSLKEQSGNGCKIVLASALPLDAMLDWHDEFKTWLLSGINVGIGKPSAETLLAFLKSYLTENGISTSGGLAEYLYSVGEPNFRVLAHTVMKLQFAAQLENVAPTLEYARKIFKRGKQQFDYFSGLAGSDTVIGASRKNRRGKKTYGSNTTTI
ncbi:MAG: DnaA ATPase domain-containing protein [Syntrophales bacterium]